MDVPVVLAEKIIFYKHESDTVICITEQEVKMKKYIIVAETGSDIPKELVDRYGIYMVPMHVTFGDVVKDDGTFPPEEVCEFYEQTGKLPKTSGCNPEDFEKVFQEIDEIYPDCHIVYMGFSAVLTCSFQSARLVAEERKNISIIDTKHVTVGHCAAIIRLAEEIECHPEWTIENVEREAVRICNTVKMSFVPSNLDYLRAGGRVSNATALCGNLLSIHPQIEVIDGYLKPAKKYRGKMEKVISSLIIDYCEEQKFDYKEIWLACSNGFSEELKNCATKRVKELGFQKINWVDMGGVITTHSGPSTFCIAGFTRESEN